jgi:DNA-directed RNA polymerase subunit RPC12/RpoP
MKMALYTCPTCGMSVGAITCGICGKELVHETLTKDDGSTVHVSKCPNGHGMIKSPMCCGTDMTCAI